MLKREEIVGENDSLGELATEILGKDEILGGDFVGQDEREAAREGSQADRIAMRRRTSKVGYNSHLKYT
jgi:hypothetical protein